MRSLTLYSAVLALFALAVLLPKNLTFSYPSGCRFASTTRLYNKKGDKFREDSKKYQAAVSKAQLYLKMKELKEIKEGRGEGMEAYKEKLLNGSFTNLQSVSASEMDLDVDNIITEEARQEYGESKKGYKKFVGRKGKLENRLRAVVAFKRNTMAADNVIQQESGMTRSEERELEEMMEDDSDDDQYFDEELDEEEMEYETAVMKAMETNKLNELKRNFRIDNSQYDKAMNKRIDDGTEEMEDVSQTKTQLDVTSSGLDTRIPGTAGYWAYVNNSTTSASVSTEKKMDTTISDDEKEKNDDDDLYTPTRSSWGVFERPRDISRAYGGGRAISKEEMDRMDAEWEERQQNKDRAVQQWRTESMKKEKEYETPIKRALERSRTFMAMGNRKGAVTELESVQNYCSWTSDLGGEVLLELAMCLETVDRQDDARSIYGKLAATSWNQKIKRNALQLIQGLDITKQIRKDVSPRKPAMDSEGMYKISAALQKGLTNEWDEYDKDLKKRDLNVQPWLDDGSTKISYKIETVRDAYYVLNDALSALRGDKIPSATLRRAFRKMTLGSDAEKYAFLKKRGQTFVKGEGKKSIDRTPEEYMKDLSTNPVEGSFFASIGVGRKRRDRDDENLPSWQRQSTAENKAAASSSPSSLSDSLGEGGVMGGFFSSLDSDSDYYQKPRRAGAELGTCSEIFHHSLNGTWDLCVSISDQIPYIASRYESGSVRRSFNIATNIIEEKKPTFWGLSTVTISERFDFNFRLSCIEVKEAFLSKSPVPAYYSLSSDYDRRDIQVVFADDTLMITRQVSSQDKISDPDIYVLWKKCQPVLYKQYYNKYKTSF
jgi:hypothetical protein